MAEEEKTIEEIEYEQGLQEALDEIKKEYSEAIDTRVKELQRMSEDAYNSIEMSGVRMRTASGFIEAKNMLCSVAANLFNEDNDEIQIEPSDILRMQSLAAELLEEITNDLPTLNIYEFSNYLDKFVDRDVIETLAEMPAWDIMWNIAWQSMTQAICRACDDALTPVLNYAADSEIDIKHAMEHAADQGISWDELENYEPDNGELYLSFGEDFWNVQTKKVD